MLKQVINERRILLRQYKKTGNIMGIKKEEVALLS